MIHVVGKQFYKLSYFLSNIPFVYSFDFGDRISYSLLAKNTVWSAFVFVLGGFFLAFLSKTDSIP